MNGQMALAYMMTALSARLPNSRPNKTRRLILGSILLSVGVVLGAMFLIGPMEVVEWFPIPNPAVPSSSDIEIVRDLGGYVEVRETYREVWLASVVIEVGIILVLAGGLFWAGYAILPIQGKGLILSFVILPLNAFVAVRSALDGNSVLAWLCGGIALGCLWDLWKSFRDTANETIGTVRFTSGVVLRILGLATLMVISGVGSGLFWGVAFSGYDELDDLLGPLFLSVLIGLWGGWVTHRLRRHPVSTEDEERWRRVVARGVRVSPYLAVGAWCLGLGVGL